MLHALMEYARQEELTVEPGLKPKTVRWLLVYTPAGEFLRVNDQKGDDKKSKGRVFSACPDLTQQEMVAAGTGCRHFLVDGVDVVTLLTKDGQVEDKLAAKHAFFVGLLRRASSDLPVLEPIADSLSSNETLEAIRVQLAEGKAKPTDLVTFVLTDVETGETRILVEHDDWLAWWRNFRTNLAEQRATKSPGRRRKATSTANDTRMRCLLSGDLIEPQATHNKIEGLSDVGGLSMGDALTSFDKDAFCSFGLAQARNAAMSEATVKTYSSALNHLVRNHSHRLAGVKVVYWYSHKVTPDEDLLDGLFTGLDFGDVESLDEPPPEEAPTRLERAQAQDRARQLLNSIRSGERSDLRDCRFYALTLSANSGRVVIRDWMEGPFTDLVESVTAWFEDLAIVARDGRAIIRTHKFAAVLAAPLRDLKDAAEPLVAAMWRAAIRRQSIPNQVMAQTLNRVRIDLIQGQAFRHARFGLLKAFCNREERVPNMTTELNDHETDPAYLCGRIMAILAAIQNRAMPGVGVGIVQRYYAAVSATPALILGRLIRTAQVAHLPKIESEGLRRWFENQLVEVWSKLSKAPPRVLTLEEQTLFAMGYYHQQANRSGVTSDAAEEQTEAVTQ